MKQGCMLLVLLLLVPPGFAQDAAVPQTSSAATTNESRRTSAPPVTCASKAGERNHCAADTAAGVALIQTTGTGACILGKSWGYDDTGGWVSDGCSGDFLVGQAQQVAPIVPVPAPQDTGRKPAERIETWGEFEPGDGFLIGRSSVGELGISGYALL